VSKNPKIIMPTTYQAPVRFRRLGAMSASMVPRARCIARKRFKHINTTAVGIDGH
jgi:hypothetical protein